jgi:maltooligosyltrehalose trehalohydrolase
MVLQDKPPIDRALGATLAEDGKFVTFRVWAPDRKRVDVAIGSRQGTLHQLQSEGDGYFSASVSSARAGTLYHFRLDKKEITPDPASRFQPEGPHGASQVIDPTAFAWTDEKWPGIGIDGQIIYELHVGTFTQEGTWKAAARQLPRLADLGVTVIEVMPVAEFPGKFGWGYDGTFLFAPTRLYGKPVDFRSFVNQAHSHSIAVILDVVYNHLGPDGNYLAKFARDYFTDDHCTDWGEAINFDGNNAEAVRHFYASNAAYWVREFHCDGLRLDATQSIFDDSKDHILALITRSAREAAGRRRIIVVGENEPQNAQLIRPTYENGYGLDALWNDDFHHSTMVATTGKNEAYYSDYLGSAQELMSAVRHGFLYQGQRYKWQKKRRGTPALDVAPQAFITFIQNHDQIANSATGQRLHELTTMAEYKAITALLLLAPGTPMLFQGQEFASSAPFLYFADHHEELASLVKNGRKDFLAQWRSLNRPNLVIADPADPATFELCKLNHAEVKRHQEIYALHRDLLKLRRDTPVFARQLSFRHLDGAILSSQAFVLRFLSENFEEDRLLIVNLGPDLHLNPAPEPLLAPPFRKRWSIVWSSEDPRYGGNGTPPMDSEDNWRIPGNAAVALEPVRQGRKNLPNQ